MQTDRIKKNSPKDILVLLVSLAGAFFSAYLFYSHFKTVSSDSILFKMCQASGVFDCKSVNSSSYSEILGIPLASLGLLYYLFIITTTVIKRVNQNLSDRFLSLNLFFSALAVISILPLLYTSSFLLKTFCLFCIFTWICNIAIFILLWFSFREQRIDFKKNLFSFFSFYKESNTILLLLSTSFLFVSLILGGRYLNTEKKAYQAEKVTNAKDDLIVKFYTAKPVEIDLKNIPVYAGNPEAKISIVEYMNFNCGACRRSFAHTSNLIKKYGDKIKLYIKHFPLDGKCNPIVKRKKSGLSCMASILAISLGAHPGYKKFVQSLISLKGALTFDSLQQAIMSMGEKNIDIKNILTNNKKASSQLASQVQEAIDLKVDGTPTFIINGKVLPSGLPPTHLLDQIIKMEIDRIENLYK